MHPDYGYFEESKLDKTYDVQLLKRLLPYTRPYTRLLLWSIGLVVLITLLELALPYVTKMAIDRHIVPHLDTSQSETAVVNGTKERFLRIPLSDPKIAPVVDRYPELINIDSGMAVIAYSDLNRIKKSDLKILRHRDVAGLALLTGLFLMLVFLDFILNFFQKLIMETTGHKMMHDLRMRLFQHTTELPIDHSNKRVYGRVNGSRRFSNWTS